MTKEKRKLTQTVMACPVLRVSMLWNSEGTNHPRGPQDQAKPAVKRHSKARMTLAELLGMFPVTLLKPLPMTAATTMKQMNIWMPPSANRTLRPSLQVTECVSPLLAHTAMHSAADEMIHFLHDDHGTLKCKEHVSSMSLNATALLVHDACAAYLKKWSQDCKHAMH